MDFHASHVQLWLALFGLAGLLYVSARLWANTDRQTMLTRPDCR